MTDQSSPIKVALVGCGRIGGRHAGHIRKAGQLVATCDTELARAEELGRDDAAEAYSSIDEMLIHADNIDVVSICSPNGLHAEHAIAALQAGCHVLCEKPMALTAQDCGAMIQAAERANRRLFVVKQNRFNPPVAALKQAIDDGKLGRIFSVQLNCFWNRRPDYYLNDPWKGTAHLDGGCLYTQFSHFIDLMYWLAGDVSTVQAFADNFFHQDTVDFEDCGVVALRFVSGALGTIHFTINSFQQNMEGSVTIFAEKGTVKIGGQYLNELEYQKFDNFEITGLAPGNPANQYGHYVGSMSNHGEVYANLMDVLQRDGIIATNGYEGLKTVEIIEKIYDSVRWNPAMPPRQEKLATRR